MTTWSYLIPPDIAVTVRAKRRPVLLAHCLGEEIAGDAGASLVLDLATRARGRSAGLLALDAEGHAVTVRGVYKAVPWTCRIVRRADGRWTLEFGSAVLREYLALHIALLPVLRRLLLDRGVALVTGAAFDMDGAVTLLAGGTGQGKTTALLRALEHGGTLIGDEYLGLSENGVLTPVVRSLALRRSSLTMAPHLFRKLSPARRLTLRASELIRILTKGRFEPLVHINQSVLGPRAASAGSGQMQRLIWLEGQRDKVIEARAERMSETETPPLLSMTQAVHDLAYGDIGAFLEAAGAQAESESYTTRWRETIEAGLRGVACYRLALPESRGAAREALDIVILRDKAADTPSPHPTGAGG